MVLLAGGSGLCILTYVYVCVFVCAGVKQGSVWARGLQSRVEWILARAAQAIPRRASHNPVCLLHIGTELNPLQNPFVPPKLSNLPFTSAALCVHPTS